MDLQVNLILVKVHGSLSEKFQSRNGIRGKVARQMPHQCSHNLCAWTINHHKWTLFLLFVFFSPRDWWLSTIFALLLLLNKEMYFCQTIRVVFSTRIYAICQCCFLESFLDISDCLPCVLNISLSFWWWYSQCPNRVFICLWRTISFCLYAHYDILCSLL